MLKKLTTLGLALLTAATLTLTPALAHGGKGGDRLEKIKAELSLTDQQVEQLKNLHQSRKEAFRNVLTPEQRAAFENRQPGERGSRPELTEAQKEQLKQSHEAFKARFEQILTPEQLQKLEQMKSERGNHRHHRSK